MLRRRKGCFGGEVCDRKMVPGGCKTTLGSESLCAVGDALRVILGSDTGDGGASTLGGLSSSVDGVDGVARGGSDGMLGGTGVDSGGAGVCST